MDDSKLEKMKYNELQKLAKQNGIKANMKLDKLRKALLDHFKTKTKNMEKPQSNDNGVTPKSTIGKASKTPTTTKTPNVVKTPNASKVVPVARKLKDEKTPKNISSPKPAPKASKATEIQSTTTSSGSGSHQKRSIPEEPTPEPPTKRRRSTFEKVPTPELHSDKAPEVEHTRRSTYVVKTPQSEKKSDKVMKTPKEIETKTQIPRFAAFLAKRKQETETESKPITPGKNKDWKKIHERNFDKMESIDEYLEKKRKRNENYADSVKKTKQILNDTLAMVNKLKSYKTPTAIVDEKKKKFINKTPNAVPFKPSVLTTQEMNLNFSESRKSPRTSSATKPFKPTVFSTKNMNLNFSSPTPSRKSTSSAFNKSKTTPFKFNASLNNTLNGSMSAKRPTFDLQASLARPMTWKAHKGKLKPFNSQAAFNKSSSISVKTPNTQTRDDRRKVMAAKRSSAKFNTAMERRGIKS
ncbi:nucleolar and spindle-associated protein 1-like [Saccostrea echinata]|uniref:nucleolar and spindle-associated protein 1-like n=1 Tax=Saccostrea echinata TaxID=191078 RepID=UPI002A8009AF|nr:nucleolar and spindle-associated protein 1-like [Saccostrea echinata]